MAKQGGWANNSAQMIALFDTSIAPFPADRKTMFGAPCYFVNGNMFAGLISDRIFARFSENDRRTLLDQGLGEEFVPRQGRSMKEYRTLGQDVITDPDALHDWLGRSYAYVRALPPKRSKR